ncbi:MAG: DUF4384 domain-containing protein [Sulfurimonas sp.]|nr:DUF4384 domain-containing protein [Sulfurimonas sp.]
MIKSLWISAVCIAVSISADISGVGIAQTNKEAKKEALADLSQIIKCEVRSSFESRSLENESSGSSSSSSNIKISSNLPILGADVTFVDRARKVEARVGLSPQKVNELYTKKLQNIKKELESIESEAKKTSLSSLKLELYSDAYSLLKEYDRYESVAMILGSKLPSRPSITKSKIKLELAKLNSHIDTIGMACTVLAKSFKQKNIYVYPPLMKGSTTVSKFGSVFVQKFKPNLKNVKNLKKSSYILVGEYVLTKNIMMLNYELLSRKTNEIVASKTININKKAYEHIETKPKNIDFDALLNSGVISSSSLKVSLNSNRGSENLLFHGGEEIELFVKLNKMGYVYIVGYTQSQNIKLSYLVELSEGSGDSRFVKFINADDASRWISLGKFQVGEPFGVESLQVIASNRKISSLPAVAYDEKSEYYVISKDIKKALSTTRGIKRIKSNDVELSEDVMSFTTMSR